MAAYLPSQKGLNTHMLRYISRLPISRRLIMAFALAAILPSIAIALTGLYYVNELGYRTSISKTMANAQTNINGLNTNLQSMYNTTKDLQSQVQASLIMGNQVTVNVNTTVTTITSQASAYNADLSTYQSTYDPSASQNMNTVLSMLN